MYTNGNFCLTRVALLVGVLSFSSIQASRIRLSRGETSRVYTTKDGEEANPRTGTRGRRGPRRETSRVHTTKDGEEANPRTGTQGRRGRRHRPYGTYARPDRTRSNPRSNVRSNGITIMPTPNPTQDSTIMTTETLTVEEDGNERPAARRLNSKRQSEVETETPIPADTFADTAAVEKDRIPLDTEPLRVLTYNICWGCMEGDLTDKTGMQGQLGKVCLESDGAPGPKGDNGMGIPITQCARNMGAAIARYHSQVGDGAGYDLMAFQEASNFDSLELQMRGVNLTKVEFGADMIWKGQPIMHNKGAHQGQQKKAWVVSLYNELRLGKPSVKVGGVEASDPGRPYLILIFDTSQLVFINIHNCQPRSGPSWKGFLDEMMPKLMTAFQAKAIRKEYRVILAGDFNDISSRIPGSLTVPWNGATLNLTAPLAQSCCYPRFSPPNMQPGDYIFDSKAVVQNRVPPSYDNKVAQSDHWPVEAELSPLNSSNNIDNTDCSAYEDASECISACCFWRPAFLKELKVWKPGRCKKYESEAKYDACVARMRRMKDMAQDAGHRAKDLAQDAGHKVKGFAQDAKNLATELWKGRT